VSDFIKYIFADFGWLDLIDVLIVFILVYRTLLWIRGTRAMQILIGIAFLGLIYFSSIKLGLSTMHELLSMFFNYLFIIIIILFQDDIRKALATVGKTPFMGKVVAQAESESLIEELVKSCIALSRKRIGALIVLERSVKLREFIEVGISLDSKINAELILSIFTPASPIHDGAVIVANSKIIAAGCFLPLTRNTNIEKTLGTRHRAAIGIAEETDAVVLVVSEEQREVSIAMDGHLIRGLDGPSLRKKLHEIFGIQGELNAN